MKMLSSHSKVRLALRKAASPTKARFLQKYFKTGPGEYGEGDIFLGITVPELRKIAYAHTELPRGAIRRLLHSKIHEDRTTALMILGRQFYLGSKSERKAIFQFFMANRARVNNWDLVDGSAPQIVGAYLSDRPRSILYKLARSKNLWDRRIAVVATYTFIRNGDFEDIFALSKLLITDREDLMHKALGWMLREVGKRDRAAQRRFLIRHYQKMPRTMLRYAIEHYSPSDRKKFLQGTMR